MLHHPPRTALYAGSFDPVTNGHLDVMRQAMRLCDRLVCAIGVHPGKKPLFSADERVMMLEEVAGSLVKETATEFACITFSDLVIDAAKREKATLLIRGLRDSTDFDYEMQMAGMNAAMAPNVQTIFIPASPDVRHITATLVRQIAAMGGNITGFAPKEVVAALKVKFRKSAK